MFGTTYLSVTHWLTFVLQSFVASICVACWDWDFLLTLLLASCLVSLYVTILIYIRVSALLAPTVTTRVFALLASPVITYHSTLLAMIEFAYHFVLLALYVWRP